MLYPLIPVSYAGHLSHSSLVRSFHLQTNKSPKGHWSLTRVQWAVRKGPSLTYFNAPPVMYASGIYVTGLVPCLVNAVDFLLYELHIFRAAVSSLHTFKLKLNPSRAFRLIRPVLIPGFRSASGWEYMTPPGYDAGLSQVNSLAVLVPIYSWVNWSNRDKVPCSRTHATAGLDLTTLQHLGTPYSSASVMHKQ